MVQVGRVMALVAVSCRRYPSSMAASACSISAMLSSPSVTMKRM